MLQHLPISPHISPYLPISPGEEQLNFVLLLIQGLDDDKPWPANLGRGEDKRFLLDIVSLYLPYISPYLDIVSSQPISPHLPISPHISPYLPISRHREQRAHSEA